jgi:hypothetical protein
MGMFDYVIVETDYPKKGFWDGKDWFQTKDFDNIMGKLTITKDGRLVRELVHYEKVPEEERPYFNDPDFKENVIKQFYGSMKTIVDGMEDLNFHGTFRFYNYHEGNWAEYEAKFTDGTLQSIILVKEEILE